MVGNKIPGDEKLNEGMAEYLRGVDKNRAEKLFNQKKKEFKSKIARLAKFKKIIPVSSELTKGNISEIANRAVWLEEEDREIVATKVWSLYEGENLNVKTTEKLNAAKKAVKLLGILLSIPYAEMRQDLDGTLNDFIYEWIIKFKEFLKKNEVPSSYTPWQVPVPQIKRLLQKEEELEKYIKERMLIKEGVSEKEKERISKEALNRLAGEHLSKLNNEEAVEDVIKIIIKNIGLDKNLPIIFAQYNHTNPLCVNIAGIQAYLNLLREYALAFLNSLKEMKKIEVSQEKKEEKNKNDLNDKGTKIIYHLKNIWLTDKEEDLIEHVEKGIKKISEKNEEINKLWSSISNKEDSYYNFLKEILDSWPYCDIDGGVNYKKFEETQVRNALKAAFKFFGLTYNYGIEHIKEQKKELKKEEDYKNILEKTEKMLLKIDEINNYDALKERVEELLLILKNEESNIKFEHLQALPTYTGKIKNEKKENILKTILSAEKKEMKDFNKFIIDTLRNDYEVNEIVKEKTDEEVLTFFRRNIMKNNGNVAKYVKDALFAYTELLGLPQEELTKEGK